MKQTAIQQAIVVVRNRMESMNETLMGKHTAHHLQQVERDLYVLLEQEREQIIRARQDGLDNGFSNGSWDSNLYYNETYKQQ